MLPSEYCYAVCHGKTRMMWLPDGEKIMMLCLFVLTQSTNVTDTNTHTAWLHRPRLCIASRGKNGNKPTCHYQQHVESSNDHKSPYSDPHISKDLQCRPMILLWHTFVCKSSNKWKQIVYPFFLGASAEYTKPLRSPFKPYRLHLSSVTLLHRSLLRRLNFSAIFLHDLIV